jgi:hypothetical protein
LTSLLFGLLWLSISNIFISDDDDNDDVSITIKRSHPAAAGIKQFEQVHWCLQFQNMVTSKPTTPEQGVKIKRAKEQF